MKFVYLFLFFLIPAFLSAQVTVVSTQPPNNTKNVPLTTQISITFSEALDTVAMENGGNDSRFSDIDSVISSGFSSDAKTMYANVVLQPNRPYFIAFTFAKAKSGAALTIPYISYFTTGSDFPPYSVSGTVLSGSTGVSAENAIVGLSSSNFMEKGNDNGPKFTAFAKVNSNGTFSIPYVPSGTYWPLAAKDADYNGTINPDGGTDVIAVSDSIVVNSASVSNLNLTFMKVTPRLFHEAIAQAETLAVKNLPADRVLRRISGYEADTLGRSRSWEFTYTYNGNTMGKTVRVGSTDHSVSDIDYGYFSWMLQLKPVTNIASAATSATVVASVENAGGRNFRKLPVPQGAEFRIELNMSDAKNGWFGGSGGYDPEKIYWIAAYVHNIQVTNDSANWVDGRFFLCDLTTGAVLQSRTMGVADDGIIPATYVLEQNYPNPFNPSTSIRFILPSSGMTTMTVYDLLGREVAVLVNEKKEAGEYTVPFNASMLTSGVYFYQLRSGSFVETKKMMLVK